MQVFKPPRATPHACFWHRSRTNGTYGCEHGEMLWTPTSRCKVIFLTMVDANQAAASKLPVLHVAAPRRYFLQAPSFDAAALLLAGKI